MKNKNGLAAPGPRADQEIARLRSAVAEAPGMNPNHAEALRLVTRVLDPTSTHDDAIALFLLLERTGWHGVASGRRGVAFFAQFQTLLYRDDWHKALRHLTRNENAPEVERGREKL